MQILGLKQDHIPLSSTSSSHKSVFFSDHGKAVHCSIAIASAQTTTFDHANMDGAVIKEAEFGKRGSGGSSFYNTSLEGAILDEMNCILCQMLRAHMHRVSIIKCDFEGAFLRWANLTSAKLSEVSLQGADLQGATLRWAVLTSVQLQAANLMAANLVQAFFEPGSLGSSAGADLRGAVAMGANASQRFCCRLNASAVATTDPAWPPAA